MRENKVYRLINKCQFASIFILGFIFCLFEKRIGISNYNFYKDTFKYMNYLNENIILMICTIFILFAGVSLLYSSADKLEASIALETLLMATIFVVWALLYKNRKYYYYGIVFGIILNTMQNIKLFFNKYN